MTAVFKEGVLSDKQTLPIANAAVKELVEKLVATDIKLDKRFVYYLLGSTASHLIRRSELAVLVVY